MLAVTEITELHFGFRAPRDATLTSVSRTMRTLLDAAVRFSGRDGLDGATWSGLTVQRRTGLLGGVVVRVHVDSLRITSEQWAWVAKVLRDTVGVAL
jgi:hypothetical protein